MKLAEHPPGVLCAIHRGEVGAGFSHFAVNALLPPGSVPDLLIEGSEPAWQRTAAVEYVLANKAMEWLAFVDVDEAPARDAIWRLLEAGPDLVSGVVLQRKAPFGVSAWHRVFPKARRVKRSEVPQAGLLPVAACGTGCLLIRRRVLEKIGGFRCGQLSPTLLQEDVDFTLRAGEAGFTPYLCGDVRVDHEVRGRVFLGADGRAWLRLPGGEALSIPLPELGEE